MKVNAFIVGFPYFFFRVGVDMGLKKCYTFFVMKKRGKKSDKEKEQIIDDFIRIINLRYEEKCLFIDEKYIAKELEKFVKWGYAIGRPIMFRIDQLIKWKVGKND